MSKDQNEALEALGLIELPEKIETPKDNLSRYRNRYLKQLRGEIARLDKVLSGEVREEDVFEGKQKKFFVRTNEGYVYRVLYAKLDFELKEGKKRLGIPASSLKELRSKIVAIKQMVEDRNPASEKALVKMEVKYAEQRATGKSASNGKTSDPAPSPSKADATPPKADTKSTKATGAKTT